MHKATKVRAILKKEERAFKIKNVEAQTKDPQELCLKMISSTLLLLQLSLDKSSLLSLHPLSPFTLSLLLLPPILLHPLLTLSPLFFILSPFVFFEKSFLFPLLPIAYS